MSGRRVWGWRAGAGGSVIEVRAGAGYLVVEVRAGAGDLVVEVRAGAWDSVVEVWADSGGELVAGLRGRIHEPSAAECGPARQRRGH